MAAEHSSYEQLAQPRRKSAEYHEGYAEARRAFLIGQAVRERRLALGLSQVEVAARAGMTQPACPGWKLAGSCRRSRCWNGSAPPSTPISSWRSLRMLPDLWLSPSGVCPGEPAEALGQVSIWISHVPEFVHQRK